MQCFPPPISDALRVSLEGATIPEISNPRITPCKVKRPLLLGRAGCVLGQSQQRSWDQGKVCSLAAVTGDHCHFFLGLDFNTAAWGGQGENK